MNKNNGLLRVAANMDDNILLSTVIISRNTEGYIERCIESVIEACRGIENEIILVDSASTDRTLEIAEKYPIKILKIKDRRFLSAAAGRYIGFRHSRGKYIFFFDGDSVLDADWFKNALPELEQDPALGGVTGFISQEAYDNYAVKGWIEVSKEEKPGGIRWFYADSLLKRETLEKAGNFNPWLKSMEEGELSYRILKAGFKLRRLPCSMAHHLGGVDETIVSFIRRKIISTLSLGQILKYSLGEKNVLNWHIRDSKFIILVSLILSITLLSLPVLYVFEMQRFIFFIPSLMLPTYLWIAVEKRDVFKTLFHIVNITLLWPFLILGFLKPLKQADEYPAAVDTIKN